MAGEKPGSPDTKKTPPRATVVVDGAPEAGPVEVKEQEKPQQKNTEKTDLEKKKEATKEAKDALHKKQLTAQEIAEGTKVYQDELFSLEGLDGPGVVPARPDQKMVKKEDFERSQEELQEQENKTAKAIEAKMDAELASVVQSGTIDSLDPEDQKKIRTEIVRNSLDLSLIPEEKKKEILSTMTGANGLPIDIETVHLADLTPSQKAYLLNSPQLSDTISQTIDTYTKLQQEAKKTGKKLDPDLIKKLISESGLHNTDSLDLSQIHPGIELSQSPSDSHIGVVQRVLAESTFEDLQETLAGGLRWSHVPDAIKREIVFESFSYDPAKNNTSIEQSISEAKTTLSHIGQEKKPGESDTDFSQRLRDKTGIKTDDLNALSHEARKEGLSPFMRALADFFAPIGAALGLPFWKDYMGENLGGGDDDRDDLDVDRTSDARGGKANIGPSVLRSNKGYLDNGAGLRLEGGSYEKQAKSASEAIKANQARYMRVAEKTGVPWELIGAIHFRESSLNFNTCLHNGDPLGRKTVRVPAGRGPFATWEEAAIDALNMKGGLGFPGNEITQSSQLEQVASYAEKYNGFGYRNKGVASAYVWAGTEAYTGGMYVADHVFSRTKKDPRPGVMAIISRLVPDVTQQERKNEPNTLASTAGAFSREFQSVGAKRNPATGTTLCSQTAREDLYAVLGRYEDVPRGNADEVHGIYRDGKRFDGMVGDYRLSFDPPENANVADVSLTSRSRYGHRVTAYKGPNGWMVLDPYNGGAGPRPQPWDTYVKKNDVRGVAFYQNTVTS